MRRYPNIAVVIIILVLISVFSLSSKYAMSSDPTDNTSKYRIEYVAPENSKLKLSGDALKALEQENFLVATIKVDRNGYIPPGIEIRTRISPLIFTANIPREMLKCLLDDPAVISIEPACELTPSSVSLHWELPTFARACATAHSHDFGFLVIP
jgi:hypothetical protein